MDKQIIEATRLIYNKVILGQFRPAHQRAVFQLQEILQRINARMEVLAGRDHKIGHSYFLHKDGWGWEDYLHIFTNKIVPLLQEYFYGDSAASASY